MRNRAGARGRPRAPVPADENGFDSKQVALRRLARSPRPTAGYGVHRVFKVASQVPRGTSLPSRHHRHRPPGMPGRPPRDGGILPERSRGYGLSTRPPDVHRRARARQLVFEDPRSGRARSLNANAHATLLTFDAVFPDTFRSVGPTGHPAGLPLLGFVQRSPLRRPTSTGVHSQPTHAESAFGTSLPRPVHVPSSWFPTTSTAFSSTAARVSCNALPTLGFIPFQLHHRKSPRSHRTSSECHSLPFEAFPPSEADSSTDFLRANAQADRKTDRKRHQHVAALFTASLAPSPFPSLFQNPRRGRPHVRFQSSSVGPRGLPPRTGPLRFRQLPAVPARCSPGLARTSRPPPPRTAGTSRSPRERQRPHLPAP
jgi:hypothetical protein